MDNNLNDIFGIEDNNLSGNNGMNPPNKPKLFRGNKIVIALVAIVLIAGIFLCGLFVGQASYSGISKEMPMFDEAYELIKKYYYKDISIEEFEKIITAYMAGSLDPYSGIVPVSTLPTPALGINMKVDDYNVKTIYHVYTECPAAGKLMRGDVILAVSKDASRDDISSPDYWLDVKYMDQSVFSDRIAGMDTVRFKVERDGEEVVTDVMKKTVYSYDKKAYYLDTPKEGVGYISLNTFVESTDDFMQAMYDFSNSGNHVLILDLRDNGGGYSTDLAKIVRNFIPNPTAKDMVIEIKGKSMHSIDYATEYVYEASDDIAAMSIVKKNNYIGDEIKSKYNKDFKLVIVANDSTASASEAFIGNIMHYMDPEDYAIIGETPTTYGKGIAQGTFNLESTNDYKLTITMGYYYVYGKKGTAEENSLTNIHGKGYPLDNDGIQREYKNNIFEESAIIRAMEIFS